MAIYEPGKDEFCSAVAAIIRINPKASVTVHGAVEANAELGIIGEPEVIDWNEGTPEISAEDIAAKKVELEAEWDSMRYSRNREMEYPDAGTQFEKIYDDGLAKWKTEMVDPVKAKWPKDNSGPIE